MSESELGYIQSGRTPERGIYHRAGRTSDAVSVCDLVYHTDI